MWYVCTVVVVTAHAAAAGGGDAVDAVVAVRWISSPHYCTPCTGQAH